MKSTKLIQGLTALILVSSVGGCGGRKCKGKASATSKTPTEAKASAKAPKEDAGTADLPKTMTLDLGLSRLGNVKMELVLIPAGEFLMGSPTGKYWRFGEAQHRVRISRPFYMGKYEVTQVQWNAVMGKSPSRFKGDNLPVERVSWNDSQEFLDQLYRRTGKTVRLPTEAEWEYACRAAITTPYHFGETISTDQANYQGNWTRGGVWRSKTMPVGTFTPNAWGLYDMHGNVWEWCRDWYAKDYYGKSPLSDPTGPIGGAKRVLRGGSWFNRPWHCRSAYHARRATPDHKDFHIGFRVVLWASSSTSRLRQPQPPGSSFFAFGFLTCMRVHVREAEVPQSVQCAEPAPAPSHSSCLRGPETSRHTG